jgi:hypothetical protein
MKSTNDWWRGELDWSTPAAQLLRDLVAALPPKEHFEIAIYGSAPLQMTVDGGLLSGDIDIFSADDQDLNPLLKNLQLDKTRPGLHFEAGFELSFRTSPRWRTRTKNVVVANVTFIIPHPIDILIGKLDRLEAKDLAAFRHVITATGHPTPDEMKIELQNAVDLFRPGFDEESPNRYLANTERLWREIFSAEIDVRREIIAPAMLRRRQGYGETAPDYKSELREP